MKAASKNAVSWENWLQLAQEELKLPDLEHFEKMRQYLIFIRCILELKLSEWNQNAGGQSPEGTRTGANWLFALE